MGNILLIFVISMIAEMAICIFGFGVGEGQALCLFKNTYIAERVFVLGSAVCTILWGIIIGNGISLAFHSIVHLLAKLPI